MTAGGCNPPAYITNQTAFFSIMDSSFLVAKICNTTIFDIMEQNAETVIFVINYIIEKGTAGNAQNGAQDAPARSTNNGTYYDRNGVKHVRVDSKTATGGWY